MHLLLLDHRLPRFCDRKCQHYFALLDALPPRFLGGCLREVPHQHVLLYLVLPVIYALQGHEVVAGAILSPHLKSAVPSNTWDGDVKDAELAQEEEQCWTQVAKLGAKVCAVLGRRKAQVERGPATFWRVGGTADRCDHPQLRSAIEIEGVWARGDVHFVGNGEDGLETDALLACTCIYARYT